MAKLVWWFVQWYSCFFLFKICRYNETWEEMLLVCINWERSIWVENQFAVRAVRCTADYRHILYCGYTVTYAHRYVRTYVCLYVCMYVCMYGCMYVCIYVCMYVSLYVCIYVCVYVSMFVCVYVCMSILHSFRKKNDPWVSSLKTS